MIIKQSLVYRLLSAEHDALRDMLGVVFAILVLSGIIVGYTKIYNVVSFTCLINNDWEGSPGDKKGRELARQGNVAIQFSLGHRLVSGVCLSSSSDNRREGLEWLQKAAQNEPSVQHVNSFYSYARLYVNEEPSFLPVATRLVMNTVGSEDKKFVNLNEMLRLDKAIIECERSNQEWQQCREIMRDATEAGHYTGKLYYAEILARGLGGDTNRDRAMELIDELIAIAAQDLPALPAVSEMEALQTHKKNLLLSN